MTSSLRAHDVQTTVYTDDHYFASLLHTLATTEFLGYDKGPSVYVGELDVTGAPDPSVALCDLAEAVLSELGELYAGGYDYERVFYYAADTPGVARLTEESLSAVVRLEGTTRAGDYYWIPFKMIQAAAAVIRAARRKRP